jgi:single-strand DNA-binding protein
MLAGARSTSVPGIWAVFRLDHWREAMRTTNLFILRGYVGQEPKAFDNGKIAKVSVATNRSWIDKKSRERIEKTDWITVTVLNERDAAFVLKNVRKGAPIYAECRVAETSYEKDGKTIYGMDVVANMFDLLSRADSGEEDAA